MYVSPAWSGKRLKENQHAKPFLGLAYNTNHSLIERFLSAFAYYVKSRNGASIQCCNSQQTLWRMWPSISFLLCCILRVSYSWACTTYIPIIDQISYHLHLHLMMSPGYCYCREQQSFLAVLDHVVYFQGKSRLRVVGLKYVGSCPRAEADHTRLLFCAPRSKCHFHRERTCFLAKWFIWVQQPFYHLLSQIL